MATRSRGWVAVAVACCVTLLHADASARRSPGAAKHKRDKSASAVQAEGAATRSSAGQTRKRSSSKPAAAPSPRTSRGSRGVLEILPQQIQCPPDMVAVAGRVCVDRYEGTLVSPSNGAPLSPFYPPSVELAGELFTRFSASRERAPAGSLAALLPVPAPVMFEGAPFAVARADVVPAGYLSGDAAQAACEAAGKRLCSEAEWVTACMGEERQPFPYGGAFVQGACNVVRETHPAFELHGSASRHHLDPRLNLVAHDGAPLLRHTGSSPACASRWGGDAVYDMVGNLDEWIDDPGGAFVGGFYSRGTRSGCYARISNHSRGYFDYSTGVRCCRDPLP